MSDFPPQPSPPGDAFIAEQRHGLAGWVVHAFTAAIRRLERARGEAASPLQRTTCVELLAELDANRAEWESRIVAAFDAAIDADLNAIESADEPAALPIRLELIDEGNVDEEIAVSRLIQAAESAAEGALREIGFLWARRVPAGPGVASAYPFRPAVIARAFRKAVAGLGLPSEHRLLLLGELGAAVAGTLAPVYEQQQEALAALDPGQAAIELSLRTMSQGLSPPGDESVARAGKPRAPTGAAHQARSALEELRAGLGAPGGAPPGEAMADLMRLVTQRIPPGEYLENVVRRLAGPACRIAEQTPAVWQTSDHPLWHLLDRLLAAGAVHTDLSGGLPDDVQALEAALRALEEAGAPREGDCMAVELAVDTAVSDLRDLQPEAVADQVDAMQERLGRSDIEAALRAQIGEQLRRSTSALPVRHFLLDTWTQVMASSAQQRGVDSDPFRAQAALVDELAAAAERCRLAPLPASEIARLIAHVRLALTEAGFATQRIGVELSALARALRKPLPAGAGA
ncbi:MAG: DUF1631 family protein, partial [Burkholderiales bacterium]|nr:DUF1631 family protein [Burkholderiales bacterium]